MTRRPLDRSGRIDWLRLARAQAVGHAPALDDWRAEEVLPGPAVKTRADRLAFLEKAAFTHHHPTGTCRMGVGGEAVVGPDLKVRGMDGLYVCDASVLPSITTGPINAAIVAFHVLLVFVPIRYVYPSRTITLRPVTLFLGITWAIATAILAWQLPAPDPLWLRGTLVFPAYYLVLSLWLTLRDRAAR